MGGGQDDKVLKGTGVELRVHGVGGDPPHAVLYMPFPDDAVFDPDWKTKGGRKAIFKRRDDPNVRVFEWGDLTSQSKWFALWTLLLPFTLANVAGWAGGGWGPVALKRFLAFVSGLILTSVTVGWLALTGVLLVPDDYRAWGLPVAGLATVILGVCATHVSARYARYSPPWWNDDRPRPQILRPLTLSSPRFFDNDSAQKGAWGAHFAVAVVTWAVIGGGWWKVDRGEFQPYLETGIAWATTAGLVVVVLLAGVSFERVLTASRWRWSASAMAAGAAFLLTGAVPSAALIPRKGGLDEFRGGQAFVFLDLYGIALAAGLLTLLLIALVVYLRKSPAEVFDAEERPEAERLLRTAKARRASRKVQVIRHIDLVATAVIGTFVFGGVVVFWIRVFPAVAAAAPSRVWTDLPGEQLATVAVWALGYVVYYLVRNVWQNFKDRDRRRKVGQIWDVLTFWPKSIHPFAVRPYSERAVPELQHYLYREGLEPNTHRLTITAHSQGSVLVYAALQGLPPDKRGPTPIDLLTFGSPLAVLYAKAFPCYFDIAEFNARREALEGREPESSPKGSWRNLFRATDPVGREVFTQDFAARDRRYDCALEDPNRRPPDPAAIGPDAEYDLSSKDDKIWGHSGFRRSRTLKTLVRESRQKKADSDGA